MRQSRSGGRLAQQCLVEERQSAGNHFIVGVQIEDVLAAHLDEAGISRRARIADLPAVTVSGKCVPAGGFRGGPACTIVRAVVYQQYFVYQGPVAGEAGQRRTDGAAAFLAGMTTEIMSKAYCSSKKPRFPRRS